MSADLCAVPQPEVSSRGLGLMHPCGEPAIATAHSACVHEHVVTARVCSACACEVQVTGGVTGCWLCESAGDKAHKCYPAVTIRWDDGTVTPVQDIQGRNLL